MFPALTQRFHPDTCAAGSLLGQVVNVGPWVGSQAGALGVGTARGGRKATERSSPSEAVEARKGASSRVPGKL